jgi:3-oxoacyl-[acyl-carrier protein] reductase
MPLDLEHRIALVTGSSRGIGSGIARRLAAAGATVLIHGNNSSGSAGALVAEIASKGGKARSLQHDLSSPSGGTGLVQAAFSMLGGLDILVNNAGLFEKGPIEKVADQQIERLLSVNVRAVAQATREFARLSSSKHGRIVNVSSIAARMPSPGASIYAATKAAVESLTKSHAVELGPRGFTVNAVAPGTTRTEMSEAGFSSDALEFLSEISPSGRLGRPEDIAEVVAFLCSDAAAWITGQVIAVDGGQLASASAMLRIGEGTSKMHAASSGT